MKLINIIVNYLRHTFANVNEEVVEIAEISTDDVNLRAGSVVDITRSKMIIQINWLLLLVSFLSFLVIIFYSLKTPKEDSPVIIQNTFSLTLGYFGSTMLTYFGIKKEL